MNLARNLNNGVERRLLRVDFRHFVGKRLAVIP